MYVVYRKSEITPEGRCHSGQRPDGALLIRTRCRPSPTHDQDGEPSYSAIHAARSAEMVQLLLDNYADPDQVVDELGPLDFYSQRDNIEAMRAVLRSGVEMVPSDAISALHYAAQYNIDAVSFGG
jgi:hypothetical protein